MTADANRKIHLILLAGIVVTGLRTAYIFYERHEENTEQVRKPPPPLLNPDYYVVPKKLYPYDLKSARQLTQQPVWVKVGYYYTYYPYARHRADFAHAAGLLLPLEKLQIKDVVTDVTPGSPDQRQVMAVFDQAGKTYAFPIGMEKEGDFKVYSDDMLFIQDPHQLYKHWPQGVWQAVDQHQAKPGMNELQVGFAIGFGVPEGSDDPRIVDYPNGGKPLRITYENGKAAEIKPGG
jgi:hypothetical protein